MSFETPSTTTKRMLVKRQAVVTVTSVAEDSPTGTSSYTRPGAAKVPIGPIVGGIIAGVVAVCLVGGIWYWCHQKGEKEKEDRRIRALARTNKKNASRPNLSNHSKSAVSMQSVASTAEEKQMYSNKGGYNHGAPVGAVAASSPYVLDQDSRYAYGQERQYDSTPPSHGRQASDGRLYNQYVDAPVADPSNESASPRSAGSSGSRSPTGTTTSSSSSGSDKRSRAQQRIEAALEREAALAASNPVVRYQPARPSPLRAAEERKEDEAVPKWGSKPFRSAQTDAAQHQSEELQRPAPVTLAPPLDLNAREKSTSGEWGVAYSDVDDGAGAFEHDDYDSRSDGRKSYGPEAVAFTATSLGRQPTGYGYNTDPLRGRTVSGSGAPLGSNTHGQGRGYQPAYDPYTRSYAEEQDHAGSHDPYAVPVHRGSQAGAF